MNLFVVEIEPREKSIKKVEFNKESLGLKDMYSSLECDMVERVSLNSEVDLWIDEEGGINGASDKIGFFNIGEYQFVGKGLICGIDVEEGESVPFIEDEADFIVNELKPKITF
jgi:hypothetical protein